MAFEEERADNSSTVHIPAVRRSSRQLSSDEHQVAVKEFDPKEQPPQIMTVQTEPFSFDDKEFKLSFNSAYHFESRNTGVTSRLTNHNCLA